MTTATDDNSSDKNEFAARVADAIVEIVKTSVRVTKSSAEAHFALSAAGSGMILARQESVAVLPKAQAFATENQELLRSLTESAIAKACVRAELSPEAIELVIERALVLLNAAQTMPFETLLALHMATRIARTVFKRDATSVDESKLEASLRALDDIPTEVASLEVRHMQKGGDA